MMRWSSRSTGPWFDAAKYRATPHNSRHASCLHIVPAYCPMHPLRFISSADQIRDLEPHLKSSAIHKVFPAVFGQSAENSDCAICAPELCGGAITKKNPPPQWDGKLRGTTHFRGKTPRPFGEPSFPRPVTGPTVGHCAAAPGRTKRAADRRLAAPAPVSGKRGPRYFPVHCHLGQYTTKAFVLQYPF